MYDPRQRIKRAQIIDSHYKLSANMDLLTSRKQIILSEELVLLIKNVTCAE